MGLGDGLSVWWDPRTEVPPNLKGRGWGGHTKRQTGRLKQQNHVLSVSEARNLKSIAFLLE